MHWLDALCLSTHMPWRSMAWYQALPTLPHPIPLHPTSMQRSLPPLPSLQGWQPVVLRIDIQITSPLLTHHPRKAGMAVNKA